ncbi:UNVERIFIED_CONTAM: hypothetical protein PYX00_003748 [Menopon gallinae]|uniref:Cap-specific mRNA (nucleoside-2'-O-)-methyltransferase 2 n=1 Tax=Menopon gallinae TaxID=328185 RepID=A0AAW2I1I2_9NEOP
MASPVVNKNTNNTFRGNGYMIESIPYHRKIMPEGGKKFNRINSRDGLPNSFQRNHNNHRSLDADEINEIETFFNKKFAFKPPKSGFGKLPDVDKMFVSERWQDKDMMRMKDELNAVKNKLNNFDMDSWHRHTKAMNKASNVMKTVKNEVHGEFVTQAWCKFYEICDTYKCISKLAEEESCLNSLHLCEAPGAFITSLNHYLQLNHPCLTWKWISTTLNPYYEGNPLPKMINDDRFILNTLDRWKFGEDYTGNLMDLQNLSSLVKDCKQLGPILLITADGSIDCSNDPGEQESIVCQLFYCEIVTALHALSAGGNFIVKMFTMYEPETICLMYLLTCCFESVNVYKPATSKEGNSENYVVCLNYEGNETLKPWLKKLRSKFSHEQPQEAMFPLEEIPKDFMEQQIKCAEMFKNYQTEVIERNIYVYKSENNQASLKRMKKLSYVVANEYLRRYRLQPIPEDRQIVGENVLRMVEMPNMDAKENVGSFNDFLEKQKIRGYERLKLMAEDLKRIQIRWTYDTDIKWLEFKNYSNNFKIVFGKPVTSVHCSKFCLGKVLTMRNDIADLAKELSYFNRPSETANTESVPYSEELSKEIREIIENYDKNLLNKLKVLNYKEKLWVSLESGRNESYERCAFFNIMDLIDSLWRDDSFVLQGYPMLTQFTAGVIYMIGHLFEKIGFVRPIGQDFAVIFQNYRSWNLKMKNFLKDLDAEVEKLEDNKSVLAVIPLTDIICGHNEFYTSVTSVNSLCVQEQNRVILSQMKEAYEHKN